MYNITFPKTSLMPREKLALRGPEQLSTQELLAICLRTGTKKESVASISQKILDKIDHLGQLRQLSLQELQAIKGIGPVKAIELKAMLELAKRIQEAEVEENDRILGSQMLAEKLMIELGELKQEHVLGFYLDTQNRIIEQRLLFIGSVSRSIVEIREVLHYACKNMATSLIIVHNHPSGAIQPSFQDEEFTKKLKRSCEDMGIVLLDHLIIGKNNYYSFREETDYCS